MGRPRIYATKEAAAEAKRIQNKESEKRQKAANPQKVKAQTKKKNDKQREKINNDPQKKARVNAQKKASKERIKASKSKTIPSKTALSSITKPIQLKVSCEQSSEIGIQKKASHAEVKKKVQTPVEPRV